jgi:hypothetical protein
VYSSQQIADLKRLQILWGEMLGKTLAMQEKVNDFLSAGIGLNQQLEQHFAAVARNNATVEELLARIAADDEGEQWKGT